MKIAEAVFRIFDRQDWLRVNRARARIKVLVDKIGIDEMRKLVEEELPGRLGRRARLHARGLCIDVDEAGRAPGRAGRLRLAQRRRLGVRALPRLATSLPQRQEGFSAVPVKVPRGDLTPEQFRGLGRHRAHVHRRLRAHDRAAEPDAALGARRGALRRLAARCSSSASATPAPTRSPTSSAARAPTAASSASPARWASTPPSRERLDEMAIERPARASIHIKMSGCPNGCSQHHIANIGFYGASIKVGEHTIPAYVAHIGGQYEGGAVAYGQRLKVRLPAKRVPEAVERWIRFYEAERQDGEGFNAFAERVGDHGLRGPGRATSRCRSSSASRTMNMFIDWNRTGPFEVIRGEGECAV